MYANLVIFITAMLISKYIYSYYKEASDHFESKEHYQLVSDYYIGDNLKSQKPILWIHTSTELNARNWQSFYSRTTTSLNQPYLQITMKSIYDKCKDSFNVCLVDDDVFRRLLSWNVNLNDLAEPLKSHYRQLGISMILHKYGGMFVPQSFLCQADLIDIYQSKFFVGEEVNHSTIPELFVPGMKLMGCKRQCEGMNKFIDYQENLYKNKTQQSDFTGDIHTYLKQSGCTVINGSKLGIKKLNGEPVLVNELLGTDPLLLPRKLLGVYVPRDEILNRPKFEWFARMSPSQILESPMVFSTYVHNVYSL